MGPEGDDTKIPDFKTTNTSDIQTSRESTPPPVVDTNRVHPGYKIKSELMQEGVRNGAYSKKTFEREAEEGAPDLENLRRLGFVVETNPDGSLKRFYKP